MSKINYVIGNIVDKVKKGVIVHSLSTTVAYDAGVAKAIRDKYPTAAKAHRNFYHDTVCYTNDYRVLLEHYEDDGIERLFMLGELVLVPQGNGLYIANLIGQKGLGGDEYGPAVRYEAIDEGLFWLARTCKKFGLTKISTVPIGCGLANGLPEKILPIIWKRLCSQGIEVDMYDLKENLEISSLLKKGL